MSYLKKRPILSLVLMGCIMLCVFYLYNESVVEADDEPFPDELETIKEVATGTSIGQTDAPMSLLVDKDNNLFVIWTATHGYNHTQYSYFSAMDQTWQPSKQFLTTASTTIHSDDGIAAITYDTGTNLSRMCLFVYSNETNGNNIIRYSCLPDFSISSTRNYFSPPVPLPITYLDSTGNTLSLSYDIQGFISVTQPKANASFYAVMNAAEIDSAGIKSEYALRALLCDLKEPMAENEQVSITCSRFKSYKDIKKSNHPSIIALPNGSLDAYYSFFAGANNNIAYVNTTSSNATPIDLNDFNGEKRPSDSLTAPYLYKEYVYLAYKNSDKNGIRFSRIALADLLSGKEKAWKHCQLEDKSKFLVTSTTAPALIAYNDMLYIFYANASDHNNIGYQRIDDKTPGTAACSK